MLPYGRRSEPSPWAADLIILVTDTYAIVGDYETALEQLEAGWAVPGVPEQYWWKLTSDPLYAPLKGNPRFARLAAFRPKPPAPGSNGPKGA
jgi:hypothetical protein